ncbi:MAG: hypothetical protein HY901_11140 [Deltaproteobacteria bacterium]|nr:hypothetical protein [Deltaproteobacteria bacterium]
MREALNAGWGPSHSQLYFGNDASELAGTLYAIDAFHAYPETLEAEWDGYAIGDVALFHLAEHAVRIPIYPLRTRPLSESQVGAAIQVIGTRCDQWPPGQWGWAKAIARPAALTASLDSNGWMPVRTSAPRSRANLPAPSGLPVG